MEFQKWILLVTNSYYQNIIIIRNSCYLSSIVIDSSDQ